MLAATQRLRDQGQFRNLIRDSGHPPRHTVREEDIIEFLEVNPAASTNDEVGSILVNTSRGVSFTVKENILTTLIVRRS